MDVLFIVNLLGWLGSAAVIIAYVFVSTKRLHGDAMAYQLLNLIGGIFLAINTFYLGAYPSTVVNLMWIGIALLALIRTQIERG